MISPINKGSKVNKLIYEKPSEQNLLPEFRDKCYPVITKSNGLEKVTFWMRKSVRFLVYKINKWKVRKANLLHYPTKSSRSRVTRGNQKKMTTMATQGAFLRLRMTSSSKSIAKPTELSFLNSQLSGLRISQGPSTDVINRISLPSFPGLQPIVARKFKFMSLKSLFMSKFRNFRVVVFGFLILVSRWRQVCLSSVTDLVLVLFLVL